MNSTSSERERTEDFLLEADPAPAFPAQRIKVWYDDFTGRKYPVQRHPYGKHMKKSFSIHCVTGGAGYFAVENEPLVRLEAGDAFFIHDRQLIRYFPDENDPWEYCGISFGAHEMAPFFRRIGWTTSRVFRRDAVTERISAQIMELIEEREEGYAGEYDLSGCACRVLSLVENRFADRTSAPSAAQVYVSRAKEQLEIGYSDPSLRIPQVAAAINLSHPYLCRIFRRLEGCSPEKYLVNYRMSVAKRLLSENGYSVSETAFLCGYTDVAQFSRMYKKRYGVSPSAAKRG